MMKKVSYLSFIVFCICIVFYSCKNDDENFPKPEDTQIEGIEVKDGRLTFSSIDIFNALAEEFMNDQDEVPNKTLFNNVTSLGYKSLKSVMDASDEANTVLLKSDEEIEEEDYELVPDEFFSSMLNDKYEIEVDGVIYKVTPFGTFFLPSVKLSELYSILDNEDFSINLSTDLSEHYFYTNKVEDNLYKVTDAIYLYDTFRKKENNIYEVFSTQNYSLDDSDNDGVKMQRTSVDPYGDFSEYKYGSKTIVGKIFQGIIGFNEIHHRDWGSNRRLRVNFYDTNYLVYAALGLSGKFQKKQWIGWSKTECSEMRMGIQALKFKSWSIQAAKKPANTNVPVLNYNTPAPTMSVNGGNDFINVDLLGCYNFSLSEDVAAQYGAKLCYDFLKSKLGNSTPPENKLTYTCWVDANQVKAKFFSGRDEKIAYNTESQSKVFSYNSGIVKFTWTFGVGWIPAISGTIAESIELEEANVFITAKHNNDWKGIRVVMK